MTTPSGVLDWPARAWAAWRDLRQVLGPSRFSLFVAAFGGALLMAVPQGRELTVRLADEGWDKSVWFCIAVTLWAFQCWYWARFILDATFGPERKMAAAGAARPERRAWLVDHVPRAIAFTCHAVAITATLSSGRARNLVVSLILLALGIAFYYALVRRRDLVRAIAGRYAGLHGRWLQRADPAGRSYASLPGLSKVVFWAGFGLAALLMAWAALDPVSMGWTFGASAVPFLGFAAIVPVGSVLVYLARSGGVSRLAGEQGRSNDPGVGYPVLTLLIAAAAVFSLWMDNHSVRAIDRVGSGSRQAPSPAQVAKAWQERAPGPDAGESADVVIVASAGGGIRAAYWTATVLGALQDCAPAFRHRLLAISGVSGGSLGATTFATLLAQATPPPAAAAACLGPGPHEAAGQSVLSHDFLAPTVTGLLFTDLAQRFLPVGFLPDRARALEQGWERAWARAGYPAQVWSDADFDALWRGRQPMPALLLNGTGVQTGKRVITSNLKIDRAVFADAKDFFELFARDGVSRSVRPSTAAHNSARFTYVSPAGTIARGSSIVDGGYFENFGAKTAAEFLAHALDPSGGGIRARPIVIVISNEPLLDPADLPPTTVESRCRTCQPSARSKLPSGEILSPVLALLHTRDAHGLRSVWDLHQLVRAHQGRFYHFRLCPEPRSAEPALGWVLSKESEDNMRSQLRQDTCGNRAQFDDLARLLGARQTP
jgi:hypothetical protein